MKPDTRLSLAFSLLAALATILTIGDPGLTCDEPLDILPGRKYVETFWNDPARFFDRDVATFVFRDNAEHPPLGRWLLGLASKLGEPFEVLRFGPDPLKRYLIAGRLAPALVFAALVGLIVGSTARKFGRAAGCAGGCALLFMPRMFAHAHFGALDTFVAFFWTLALLQADRAFESVRPTRNAALAGFFSGLALATKIQGWLLFPVVLAWAIARLRFRKGVIAWLVWSLSGLAIFFAAWPWLWFDTIVRIRAYLSTGLHRTPIRVFYFGREYLDRLVPWHYPWVYFFIAVPPGIHLFGAAGIWRGLRERKNDPFLLSCGGTIVFWLLVFSTIAPVYDGERLFLTVFPFWAILAGAGFGAIWEKSERSRRRSIGRGVLILFFMVQAFSTLRMHPFGLSYYNILVGGLSGAERLGLEPTYWGDAVDRRLLESALGRNWKAGERVALVPTLAPGQGLASTPTSLLRRGVAIEDEQAAERADWVILWRRSSYWRPSILARIRRMDLVAERRRDGVWLARVYRARKKGPGLN